MFTRARPAGRPTCRTGRLPVPSGAVADRHRWRSIRDGPGSGGQAGRAVRESAAGRPDRRRPAPQQPKVDSRAAGRSHARQGVPAT